MIVNPTIHTVLPPLPPSAAGGGEELEGVREGEAQGVESPHELDTHSTEPQSPTSRSTALAPVSLPLAAVLTVPSLPADQLVALRALIEAQSARPPLIVCVPRAVVQELAVL